MRTTAIFNNKGGVGKTTTTSAMADILAVDYGKRVLVIDTDPQGNISLFYRVSPDDGNSTLDLFMGTHEPVYSDWISAARPDASVDIIPSDMGLISAEVAAAKEDPRFNRMAISDLIRAIREDEASPDLGDGQMFYDYVLMDCSPAFNQVSLAALRSADDIIIPVTTDLFSTYGMTQVLKQIQQAREDDIRHCVAGVLVNKYRPSEDMDGVLQYLQTQEVVPVYNTVIRQSPKVVPASKSEFPLIKFSPQCAAAVDYRHFVAEYVAQEGGHTYGNA